MRFFLLILSHPSKEVKTIMAHLQTVSENVARIDVFNNQLCMVAIETIISSKNHPKNSWGKGRGYSGKIV